MINLRCLSVIRTAQMLGRLTLADPASPLISFKHAEGIERFCVRTALKSPPPGLFDAPVALELLASLEFHPELLDPLPMAFGRAKQAGAETNGVSEVHLRALKTSPELPAVVSAVL